MKVVTNAPVDYDYSTAKTVKELYAIRPDMQGEKRNLRLVELSGDEYQNNAQIQRYWSGMHFTKEIKEFHKEVETYPEFFQLA
jgi:hypothetical protein